MGEKMANAPAMMSLAALVAARDAGKAGPSDMVALSRDAIERLDGDIHAFAHVPENADVSAGLPLSGISIGVKDIFDTFDMPTCYGSRAYDGHQPRTDAAIVAMARRRGATIAGKTVTTEFAWLEPGPTVNPRNHAHTPGGSSSGSAAAVAAGMVPAAIGTQTGGSIIRPASFCGIAGYKPSYRLLPATGMKHLSPTLDTPGLYAASVEDVALFAELLTGRPLSIRPVETSEARIGIYFCPQLEEADAPMQRALEKAAECAVAAGFKVEAIREPEALVRAREAHATIQDYEAGLAGASDLALHGARLGTSLTALVERGLAVTPDTYDKARRTAKRGREAVRALFDDVDILLTPSAPGAAPEGLSSTGDPRFNRLWTLMGTPAVNIPGITDAAKMPLGIQAIARFGNDLALLSVAARLEEALTHS